MQRVGRTGDCYGVSLYMAELKIPVFCLIEGKVLNLELDLSTLQSVEEISEKVKGSMSDYSPENLLFMYSDGVNPETHLRISDEADLKAIQEDAINRQCENAYFTYDADSTGSPIRAIVFFKKTQQTVEPVAIQQIEGIAKVIAPVPETRLPFRLFFDKDQTLISLKKHDFVVLEESSGLEPEYVQQGSSLIRTWRLEVTGTAWEQASIVCFHDNSTHKDFTLSRESDILIVNLQLEVPVEGCSIVFRVALDGEICGPLLWIEARIKAEISLEQQLLDLGVEEWNLEKVKQLYEIGLTDLPKLIRAWKRQGYLGMDVVANVYWAEEAD